MSKRDIITSLDGVRTVLDWDESGVNISRFQDASPIVRRVHDLSQNRNKKAGLQYAGSVPVDLHNQWVEEAKKRGLEGQEVMAYCKMKLNSPEYSRLRNQTL